MKLKIVIVSDDVYYLTGISKGMKESGTRVESIFLSDAAEFERFTLTTSFSLQRPDCHVFLFACNCLSPSYFSLRAVGIRDHVVMLLSHYPLSAL